MNPAAKIYAYVLEKAASEPMLIRADLYRSLSSVIGDENLSRSLLLLAEEIASIELKHRQMLLDLERPAPPSVGENGDGIDGTKR